MYFYFLLCCLLVCMRSAVNFQYIFDSKITRCLFWICHWRHVVDACAHTPSEARTAALGGKKSLGSVPMSNLEAFYGFSARIWALCVCSSRVFRVLWLLPQLRHMQVRFTGISNDRMNGCVSLCVSPVMNCWPIQVVPRLHPMLARISSVTPSPCQGEAVTENGCKHLFI